MNPRDALIGLIGAIICLFASTMGVLMAVSPARLIGFGLWVGRLMGFPKTDIRWNGSNRREWQVGGYLLAATSLLIGGVAFQVFLNAIQSSQPALTEEAAQRTNGDLYLLVGSLAMFALGLFTIIRAKALFVGMQAKSGFISLRSSSSQRVGILVFRIVGLVWILGALTTVWRWIIHTS